MDEGALMMLESTIVPFFSIRLFSEVDLPPMKRISPAAYAFPEGCGSARAYLRPGSDYWSPPYRIQRRHGCQLPQLWCPYRTDHKNSEVDKAEASVPDHRAYCRAFLCSSMALQY